MRPRMPPSALTDEAVVSGKAVPARAAQSAARHGGRWFAEEYLAGREFNVSAIEVDGRPRVLPVPEMLFENWPANRPKLVNWDAKWNEDHPDLDNTSRCFVGEADAALAARLTGLVEKTWTLFRTARLRPRGLPLRRGGQSDDPGAEPEPLSRNPARASPPPRPVGLSLRRPRRDHPRRGGPLSAVVPLAGPYICLFGAPVLNAVHPQIFALRYFTRCMDCGFCGDDCLLLRRRHRCGGSRACRDASPGSRRLSASHPANGSPDTPVADPEFPSGAYLRTRVHNGHCVFQVRGRRGCAIIHSHCPRRGPSTTISSNDGEHAVSRSPSRRPAARLR